MNVRPLQDRLLVRRVEEETKTKGGLFIPDAAKEKPTKGEVIAVGEGKFIDATGGVRAPKVKVGDKVIYGQYSGSAYKQDGVEYKIIKEDDVLAILA